MPRPHISQRSLRESLHFWSFVSLCAIEPCYLYSALVTVTGQTYHFSHRLISARHLRHYKRAKLAKLVCLLWCIPRCKETWCIKLEFIIVHFFITESSRIIDRCDLFVKLVLRVVHMGFLPIIGMSVW